MNINGMVYKINTEAGMRKPWGYVLEDALRMKGAI